MRDRLPRLLGAFPDAIVIIDADGCILQANAQAMAMFGFGEGELPGTSLQILFPDQPMPSPEGSRRRGRTARLAECEGRCSNSRRFRAAVTVMPIESDNGAVAVISIRDITEAQETQFILERGLALLSTVISAI
jgi:PAS domain S-box-containing protein